MKSIGLHIAVVSIMALLILSGCATHTRMNYFQEPGSGIKQYPIDSAAVQEYKVQTGDQLKFTIFTLDLPSRELFNYFSPYSSAQSGNFLLQFPVDDQGTISFPYIGDIPVAGLTLLDIKFKLENKLSQFTNNPQVEVKLANDYFSVVGEAVNGRFSLPKKQTSIYQALAISGDMKNFADRAKVKIIRVVDNKTQVKEFDLRSKDIIHTEYYYVQPNDVIYVKPYNGQFFGVDTFTTIFGMITSVVSVVLLVVGLAK